MVFDASGGVRYVQESAPTGDKKFTTATMYLVPFETITSFGPALPQFNEEPGRSSPGLSCRGCVGPLGSLWLTPQLNTQPSSSASTR